tara:strand:- start:1010 stop:1693 length:684 start_codon:yes stop_codon:yes gene_type:complete
MKTSATMKKKKFQRWFITKILTLLILITGYTARVRQINKEVLADTIKEYGSVIVATWHKNIFFSIWLLRNHDLTALISNSDDGEVIYDVFAKFGYEAVRGSTTRGGVPALKQLIKLLGQKTSVAITPDGPLGPPEKIQSGVVLLAKYSGVPIIPWYYEADSQWRLKSWDRHKIPKPFSAVVESYGEPFLVPKDLSSKGVQKFCEKLEADFKKLAEMTNDEIINSRIS